MPIDVDTLPPPSAAELQPQAPSAGVVDVDTLPAPDNQALLHQQALAETLPEPKQPAGLTFGQKAYGVVQQFAAGAAGGLVGTAVRAGAKAASGLDTSTRGPRTVGEIAARGLGLVPATVLDVVTLNELGAVADLGALGKTGKLLVDAIRHGAKAAPIRSGATLGATAAGLQSTGQQYADTGTVQPGQVLASEILGGALGGAIPAGLNAVGKIPSVARSAYESLTGLRPDAAAAQGRAPLLAQEPGELLAEATPKAREQVAASSATQEGQQQLAEIANSRVRTAAAKLSPDSGAPAQTPESGLPPSTSAEKLVRADIDATTGKIRPAQRAAQDAEAQAAEAKTQAGVGSARQTGGATADERRGTQIQTALRKFEQQESTKRDAAVAPIKLEAEAAARSKEARGGLADGTAIRQLLDSEPEAGRLPISEGSRQANTLAEWLFTSPIGAPEQGGVSTTFEKLRAAETTVKHAANRSGADPQRQSFYLELLDRIRSAEDAQTGGLWSKFRDEYQKQSRVLNYVAGGAGKVGEKAGQFRKFVSGEGEDQLNPFQMNPEKVAEAFAAQGGQGADKLRLVLGGRGFEDFAQQFLGEKIAGVSASEARSVLDKYSSFLTRAPKTKAALNNFVEKSQDAALVREQAAAEIEQHVREGTFKTASPETAKLAVADVLDKNDPEVLKRIAAALRATRGDAGKQIGRDAVSEYFRDRLAGVGSDLENAPLKIGSVASRVNSVLSAWEKLEPSIVNSGLVTKAHAADISKVLQPIRSLSAAISELPSSEVSPGGSDVVKDAALAAISTKAPLLLKLVGQDEAFRKKVAAVVREAMFSPEAAQRLASKFQGAKTPVDQARLIAAIAAATPRKDKPSAPDRLQLPTLEIYGDQPPAGQP